MQIRQCLRCVMDTTDADITFDAHGICNHCARFAHELEQLAVRRSREPVSAVLEAIRRSSTGRSYDAVIGLSGGVDSSFLAYTARAAGLRLLAIHLDNGWNSELAVSNVHNLVSKLEIELVTHVIDWEEFRSAQVAFLRTGVIDIEMLTDNAIVGVMFDLAKREQVPTILIGANLATEGVMPTSWNYRKNDLRNLKAILRHGGGPRLRTLPTASAIRLAVDQHLRGIRLVDLLNLIDYNRADAVQTLRDEVGWRDYGGKHYESFFTRYYQSHILPTKFGVDKRKAHLSALICSGQITRETALAALSQPLYDPADLESDTAYVTKKLGLSRADFDEILTAEPVAHERFASDGWYSTPIIKALHRLAGARQQ